MPFAALTPEQLLEKYEDAYAHLKAQRVGLAAAILKARARVEAGREILGRPPLAKERSDSFKTAGHSAPNFPKVTGQQPTWRPTSKI